MGAQIRQTLSLDEFEAFIKEPINQDADYEYIAGEIIRVVSNNYSSIVAMLIGGMVSVHVYQNQLGYVTGADGGYVIGDERYIPDVGFISKTRQPEPSQEAYNPNPPDLVIEVLSPTDEEKLIRLKVGNYLASHVTVWLIDPTTKQVEIYQPNRPPQVLSENDTLADDDILPDFAVKVSELFPKRTTNPN